MTHWQKAVKKAHLWWGKTNELLVQKGGAWLHKHPRWVWVILTLVWLLPGNAQLPLVDRDEPRFAYATQEMIDRGDNWVPTFNGEDRFDKPPLVYWWMRAHYALLGYNDFAARLHSVIASVLCVLVVWGFARRLYGVKVAHWAALAFLTALQVFIHGRLCVADMPMILWILLAQWAAWEIVQKSSWKWAVIFWLSLALGFATKWLVPWAVVGVAGVVYFGLRRRWPRLQDFKPFTGLALLAGVTLLWAVPAWMATEGRFFGVGIGEHFFERGVSAFNARSYNPFFYLATTLLSWMPWAALLVGVGVWARRHWDEKTQYLAAWVLGVYVLFSLAQTQLPHYVLPAWGALAIWIAAATQLKRPAGRWAGRFYRWAHVLWRSVLLLGIAVALMVPASGEANQLRWGIVALLVALVALVSLGSAIARRRMLRGAICFLAVPLAFAASAALMDNLTPAEKIARQLNPLNMPPVLVATGFQEPSLTAYTQAQWMYNGDLSQARQRYNEAPQAVLVALGEEWTLESLPSVLLGSPPRPRRDFQRELLENPPQGGRRFHWEGLHLGRFSWVSGQLYLKP